MTHVSSKTLKTSDQHPTASLIREAIGATLDEPITVVTPRFDREPGSPSMCDWPTKRFDDLRSMTIGELCELGCRQWDSIEEQDRPGHLLMLFPHEWYDRIPEGFEVHDINGDVEPFRKGETDDDKRFGVLPYGLSVPVPATK
jgi:hypothetical protein